MAGYGHAGGDVVVLGYGVEVGGGEGDVVARKAGDGAFGDDGGHVEGVGGRKGVGGGGDVVDRLPRVEQDEGYILTSVDAIGSEI